MSRIVASGRGRAVILILTGMIAGSLLGGPASAHTGRKISHLTGHLDPLYLNENQKAADANQLDGLDSTQFLRSNGKAADSDLLDGISSAGFLLAGGKATDSDLLDGLNSTAFLQGGTTYTRHFSCSGTTWLVENSNFAEGWTFSDSLLHSTTGSNLARCNVALPDSAVVTRVDFSVADSDATDDIGFAEMFRTNLISSIGTEVEMADAGGTTGAAGDQILSDTTITSPTIDNNSFAYFLQVGLEGTDSGVGVYGAIVTYSISGTAGGG